MLGEEKNGKEKEEQKMSEKKKINLIFLIRSNTKFMFFLLFLFPLLISSPFPIFCSNQTYQKTKSKGIGLFREGWMARGN